MINLWFIEKQYFSKKIEIFYFIRNKIRYNQIKIKGKKRSKF